MWGIPSRTRFSPFLAGTRDYVLHLLVKAFLKLHLQYQRAFHLQVFHLEVRVNVMPQKDASQQLSRVVLPEVAHYLSISCTSMHASWPCWLLQLATHHGPDGHLLRCQRLPIPLYCLACIYFFMSFFFFVDNSFMAIRTTSCLFTGS
jgi:hypothetical protein